MKNVKFSCESCYGEAMRKVDFGDRVSDLVDLTGLKQKEFADAIGYSESSVSSWISGSRGMSVHARRAIAKFLNVDVSVLNQYLAGEIAGDQLVLDPPVTKGPLTARHNPGDDTEQRLRRIELRLEENSPKVEVIGRVPADSLRWASIGDVYTVDVSRVQLGNARAPFGLEVTGNCFRQSVGLHAGDVVICEPPFGRDPHDRQIVVIRVGDEVTLKRWCVVDGGIELRDGDENVVHTLSQGDDFEVQGFYVTYLPLAPR